MFDCSFAGSTGVWVVWALVLFAGFAVVWFMVVVAGGFVVFSFDCWLWLDRFGGVGVGGCLPNCRFAVLIMVVVFGLVVVNVVAVNCGCCLVVLVCGCCLSFTIELCCWHVACWCLWYGLGGLCFCLVVVV